MSAAGGKVIAGVVLTGMRIRVAYLWGQGEVGGGNVRGVMARRKGKRNGRFGFLLHCLG
jgi:hypothetical protein